MEQDEMEKLITRAVAAGISASGISERVSALEEKSKDHERRISAHDLVLYGNPEVYDKPGLVGVVLQVSQSINRQQGLGWKILEWAIVAILAGIVTLLIQHGVEIV